MIRDVLRALPIALVLFLVSSTFFCKQAPPEYDDELLWKKELVYQGRVMSFCVGRISNDHFKTETYRVTYFLYNGEQYKELLNVQPEFPVGKYLYIDGCGEFYILERPPGWLR